MLLDEKIELKVSKMNIIHLKNKGYDVNCGDIIEIFTKDLNVGTHRKVRVKCDVCNNEKQIMFQKYIKNINNGGYYACSSKCAQSKVKNTSKNKFGSEYYMQTKEYKDSIKKTNLNRYGVEHHLQSKKIKEKIKNTNIKKYGVENVFSSKEIKEKIKNTNIEKYGVENPSYSNVIKNKISDKNKNIWKYKLLNEFDVEYVDEDGYYVIKCDNNKNHNFKINRKLLSNRKMVDTILCTKCNPINSSKSGYEVQLYEFIIDNCDIDIIRNERKLLNNKYELDIYIPKLKLAFEFNGLYWHNELHKENDYHLNKTELCEEQGIQLIHIYEDDWIYKQDIVKSMILNKLGKSTNKIFGRKTEVREITDNKLVRNFLNENHLQGFIGGKVKLGLFFENELVSLMTFGKRRVAMGKNKSNEGEYELLRFCSKLNANVVGGANKLFKYFIKNYELKEITTYANRSWSNGNLYKQLGFEYQGKTKPNYYYIIDRIKHYRFNFRKDKLIKEGFDPSSTERQIMLDRKIYRIYDSGNLKFSMDFQ